MQEVGKNIGQYVQIAVQMGNSVSRLGMRSVLFAVLALVVASCANSGGKARDTYDINIAGNLSSVSGATRAQLLVKLPTALKSIDSDRMISKPSPSAVTYVAGAQWVDTVPRLVQAKLVEAFENTGATGATAKPGDGLIIDYQLISDIRRFEISDGAATIEISIKLLTDKTGIVRETRIFTASTGVSGSSAEDYVEAFESAFNQLSGSVINWVLRQV